MIQRRSFLAASAAAIGTGMLPPATAGLVNDEIRLGFISCGGRANELMGRFEKVGGSRVTAICDPDEGRLGRGGQRNPGAKKYADARELVLDPNVDAVVVATCNHWHCLGAILAMENGKDVYVEKPLSHSQWEGRQTVLAAHKHNRICQIGTQQRSDPMQAEIKEFLHTKKTLGEITGVRVNRFGVRPSIGKRDTPLPIDKNVAYDLWLGPAADEPIYRNKLHYDWHWDWNTGSGEMGNWGVHVLDDVRNNVFQDQVRLPKQIFGGGGRIALNDAGQTPNVHFVFFDTGMYPVTIALSNLPGEPGGKKSPKHPGPGSGYIVSCEGGYLHGSRGRATAFDADGKKIASMSGNGSVKHQANFLDAVRSRDRSILNAEVAVGNDSTGWCNLANIAFRVGGPFDQSVAAKVDDPIWKEVVGEMQTHLEAHGSSMDADEIVGSPSMLTIDAKTETFIGENADLANAYLKRQYRAGFEVTDYEA
ncbi:MAG: Gfo/Idh/MocA family oxidoreductase [Planctomycetota bacterium]